MTSLVIRQDQGMSKFFFFVYFFRTTKYHYTVSQLKNYET